MNFDAVYTNPKGSLSRGEFVPALITVLAAIAFFTYFTTGRTPQFCVLVLLYPTFILLTQRLRNMAYPIWLVFVPGILMVTNQFIQLQYFSLGATVNGILAWVSPAIFLGFALWACVSSAKT